MLTDKTDDGVKELPKTNGEAPFKRTPQRLAILDYLKGNTSHPSAEDVFREVSKTYPSMSFATVYNTLHTLTKAGSLRELTIDPDRKRYDPDTSNHHHLICLRCGKIVDITGGVAIDLPEDMAQGYTIIGSNVEFYGYCPDCRHAK
jgi:Fur family transcriptional regulator, peroxide stress response regulator